MSLPPSFSTLFEIKVLSRCSFKRLFQALHKCYWSFHAWLCTKTKIDNTKPRLHTELVHFTSNKRQFIGLWIRCSLLLNVCNLFVSCLHLSLSVFALCDLTTLQKLIEEWQWDNSCKKRPSLTRTPTVIIILYWKKENAFLHLALTLYRERIN